MLNKPFLSFFNFLFFHFLINLIWAEIMLIKSIHAGAAEKTDAVTFEQKCLEAVQKRAWK